MPRALPLLARSLLRLLLLRMVVKPMTLTITSNMFRRFSLKRKADGRRPLRLPWSTLGWGSPTRRTKAMLRLSSSAPIFLLSRPVRPIATVSRRLILLRVGWWSTALSRPSQCPLLPLSKKRPRALTRLRVRVSPPPSRTAVLMSSSRRSIRKAPRKSTATAGAAVPPTRSRVRSPAKTAIT